MNEIVAKVSPELRRVALFLVNKVKCVLVPELWETIVNHWDFGGLTNSDCLIFNSVSDLNFVSEEQSRVRRTLKHILNPFEYWKRAEEKIDISWLKGGDIVEWNSNVISLKVITSLVLQGINSFLDLS